MPGGAPPTDFRFRPRGEFRNGAGVGLGLVTGFLAVRGGLALAFYLCACCSLSSTTSLRRCPTSSVYTSPQAGNPLSVCAVPYSPRERCIHMHTHAYAFFRRRRRVRARIEVQQPLEGRWRRRKRRGRRDRQRGRGGGIETHGVASSARLLDEGPVSWVVCLRVQLLVLPESS